MRFVLALAAWVAAVTVTVYVARHTAYGPVLFVLGPARGIHLGDVVAGVGSAAGALLVTIALVATAPARRRRPDEDQVR